VAGSIGNANLIDAHEKKPAEAGFFVSTSFSNLPLNRCTGSSRWPEAQFSFSHLSVVIKMKSVESVSGL
jgi:hypothetical protein